MGRKIIKRNVPPLRSALLIADNYGRGDPARDLFPLHFNLTLVGIVKLGKRIGEEIKLPGSTALRALVDDLHPCQLNSSNDRIW